MRRAVGAAVRGLPLWMWFLDVATGVRRKKPRVTLRFLAVSYDFSSPAEVMRVVRHRFVIGYYALGVLGAVLLHQLLLHQPTVKLETPISALTILVFMVVSILYMRVWIRLIGSRDHVTVWMPPGLVLAAGTAHVVSQGLHRVVQTHHDVPLPWWAVVLLIYAGAEGVAALACRTLVPRVQRSLRAGREALAELTEAEVEPALLAGKTRIPLADILRVEAAGNYVHVVTAEARHVLPGPFASVLAQLPQGAGCRVHRSHWVAAQAVRDVVRGVKGIRLTTVAGDEVPVAQPPSAEVEAWLRDRYDTSGAKPQAAPGSDLALAFGLPPAVF